MLTSRPRRLRLALLGACCFAVVFATGEARANDCALNNVFQMATANTCNSNTSLVGSSGQVLLVSSSSPGATVLEGLASAATGAGWGVFGQTNSTGANSFGVQGLLVTSSPGTSSAGVAGFSGSEASNGPGVWGKHTHAVGTAPGVLGETNATASGAAGVMGIGGNCGFCIGVDGSSTGNGIGVRGSTSANVNNGWGVEGIGSASGLGVYGHTPTGSSASYGVEGVSGSTGADAAGVYGTINSAAANAAGVRGYNGNPSCCGMGVAGFHAGQGIGIYGESLRGFAVSGFSPNNWSGYFQGDVRVVGTLTKTAGAFRIDNPIDPAHSYLQHSFVESPDMKNVYDGVVTTNGKGFATVKLPNWFQVLNKDFRYQLTLIGKDAWGAQAIVWEKLHANRFVIRSKKGVQVSWQVTGIRHDAYANAHRIETIVPKQGKADERYVHPELYGKPLSKSVVVLPGMTAGIKPKLTPALAKR